MAQYEIIKQLIENGKIDMMEAKKRASILFAKGYITDDQLTELESLAEINPNGTAEKGYQYQINILADNIKKEISRLDEQINILVREQTGKDLENSNIPAFVQPIGTHNAYKKGDQVKFMGKIYESLIDDNVWAPSDYIEGWKVISNEKV